MANATLSAFLIMTYDRALHGVPQRGSLLKDAVRMESGIEALTHHFPAQGKAIARARAALQPIQAGPTEKARPSCTLRNREHYEFLDQYQVRQTNVQAMTNYGKNSRMAVERACDQMVLDALDTPSSQAIGTAALPRPGAAVKVTVAALATAMTALMKRGNSTGDMMSFIYSQGHFENITKIDQLISRDYVPRGFISTGEIPTLFGTRWIGVETRAEGGIPDNTGYVIAKPGTGLALGNVQNMRDIWWNNMNKSWAIGAQFLGGSTMIDKNQFAELNLDVST